MGLSSSYYTLKKRDFETHNTTVYQFFIRYTLWLKMIRQLDDVLEWATTWQNQQNGSASSEDLDQPGHLPSLIGRFAVRMKKPWILSYPLSALRRLWSDWADAQADLSLCRAHTYFVGFVMSWLEYCLSWFRLHIKDRLNHRLSVMYKIHKCIDVYDLYTNVIKLNRQSLWQFCIMFK